jgi:hypothetical protein
VVAHRGHASKRSHTQPLPEQGKGNRAVGRQRNDAMNARVYT